MKTAEKKLKKIPVPANYSEKDMLIAGIKESDMATLSYGGKRIPVFYIYVPEDQADALLSLTWAEFNYDKQKRRRSAAGIGDLQLDEIEVDLEDTGSEDPLQALIDKEALDLTEELIEYLENKHEHFGEIFRQRLEGNFNKREIARRLGLPKTTVRRWIDEVVELAQEYYEMRNSL